MATVPNGIGVSVQYEQIGLCVCQCELTITNNHQTGGIRVARSVYFEILR